MISLLSGILVDVESHPASVKCRTYVTAKAIAERLPVFLGVRKTRMATLGFILFQQWKSGAIVPSKTALRRSFFEVFHDERIALENEMPRTFGAAVTGRRSAVGFWNNRAAHRDTITFCQLIGRIGDRAGIIQKPTPINVESD